MKYIITLIDKTNYKKYTVSAVGETQSEAIKKASEIVAQEFRTSPVSLVNFECKEIN